MRSVLFPIGGAPRGLGLAAASIALLLAALAGCRACCYPSCIPAHRGSVLRPIDQTGFFPLRAATATPAAPEGRRPIGGDEHAKPTLDGAVKPAAFEVLPGASKGSKNQLPKAEKQTAPAPPERIAETQKPRPELERLRIPAELPGADAAPLRLPPVGDTGATDKKLAAIYPALPNVATAPIPLVVGEARATLASLQDLAMARHPALGIAAAEVERARGESIQAGTRPNPKAGYQSDTVNTSNTAGYHGVYLSQTCVTAGKLDLARKAGEVEWASAKLRLERTRYEVATGVRSAYFAALIAEKKLGLNRSLAGFTEELYKTQIELVAGGESAAYEPMQLRVLALQTRAAVVRAEQELGAARRRLASAVGTPEAELPPLQGSPDMPAPAINHEQALAQMLGRHTDLTLAHNEAARAQWLLELARVTPKPNIDTTLVVQYDDTFDPGTTTYNLAVGGEVPVYNRNRGGVIAAQASVAGAREKADQARVELTAKLAEAFGRYEAARALAASIQPEALRDQVRAYRGVYQRYRTETEGIGFNDVVVAQQTLSALLTQYMEILSDQWQAIVDIAGLLQVDDIYLLGELCPVSPLPDLRSPLEEELRTPTPAQGPSPGPKSNAGSGATPADRSQGPALAYPNIDGPLNLEPEPLPLPKL